MKMLFLRKLGFWYELLVSFENTGLSFSQIVEYYIDYYEDQVMPLARFLEHGMKVQWGYHFVQVFLALRFRRASRKKE